MNEEEEKALLSAAMRLLGKRKSEAKSQTAKENGKKGGRPKKTTGINQAPPEE